MKGRDLRKALHQGDYVFGIAMITPSTFWPGILEQLGMDLVFIDTEHTPMDRQTVSGLSKLYAQHDICPIVRIPSPDPYQATMMLDGGASGIIVPYVESAAQVRTMVGAVKYKPLKGDRLQAFLAETQVLEPELEKYLENHNRDTVLVVNIESTPALAQLDEILAVKGLDAVLVGPHDLSCSLGIPEQYHHPKFEAAIQTIIEKAKAHKVGVGIHVWDQVGYDKELEWAKLGANLIMHSNELNIFTKAMEKDMTLLREALGQTLDRTSAADIVI